MNDRTKAEIAATRKDMSTRWAIATEGAIPEIDPVPAADDRERPDTLKGRSLARRLLSTPERRAANADVDWAAWIAAIEDEARAGVSPSTGDDRLWEAAQAAVDAWIGHESWSLDAEAAAIAGLQDALRAATPAPKPENPR